MSDQKALTNQLPEELIAALQYLHLARIYGDTDSAYKSLLVEFSQIETKYNVKQELLGDPQFEAALREFATEFLKFRKNRPEAEELLETVSPKQMVEKVYEVALSYPELHAQKLSQKLTHELAANYVKQANLKIQGSAVEELQKNLKEALAGSKTAEAVSQKASAVLQKTLGAGARAEMVTQVVAQNREEIEQVVSGRDKDVANAVLVDDILRAQAVRSDVSIKVKTEMLAENYNIDRFVLNEQSQRLTNVATVITSSFLPVGSDKPKINNFFQAFAEAGAQKAIAPVADFALGLFGPEKQWEIVGAITGKSFADLMANERSLRGQLGDAFVDSDVFRRFKASGLTAFPPKVPVQHYNFFERAVAGALTAAAAPGLAGNPKRLVADVFRLGNYGVLSSEFANPHPASQTGVLGSALGLALAIAQPGAITVAWRGIDLYFAAAYLRLPSSFHLDFGGASGWLLQLGARKAIGRAMAGAAAKGLGGKVIGAVAGTAIPIPIVGNIIGWFSTDILMRLGGGIIGRVKNFFFGLVGAGGKPSFFERDPALFLAAVAVGLLALFILPISFLPFNNVVDKTRSAALFTSGRRQTGGGTTSNLFQTNYNVPLPPASTISRCPVSGGHITWRPGEGDHVGASYDSYDLAVGTGARVYPAHSGYVVAVSVKFAPGQRLEGSAGNFVKIEGATADGQKYFTTYEHLLDVTPEIINALNNKTLVTPDTLLGHADDTGNSLGPHVHFQYNGPGRMTLPAGCAGT